MAAPPGLRMNKSDFYAILDKIPKDVPRAEAARMIAVWDVGRNRRGMDPKTALLIVQIWGAICGALILGCWFSRWAG